MKSMKIHEEAVAGIVAFGSCLGASFQSDFVCLPVLRQSRLVKRACPPRLPAPTSENDFVAPFPPTSRQYQCVGMVKQRLFLLHIEAEKVCSHTNLSRHSSPRWALRGKRVCQSRDCRRTSCPGQLARVACMTAP